MKDYIEIKVKTFLGDLRRRTIPIRDIIYVTENSKGNANIATRFTVGYTCRLLGADNLPTLHSETPYDEVKKQLEENGVKLCRR